MESAINIGVFIAGPFFGVGVPELVVTLVLIGLIVALILRYRRKRKKLVLVIKPENDVHIDVRIEKSEIESKDEG